METPPIRIILIDLAKFSAVRILEMKWTRAFFWLWIALLALPLNSQDPAPPVNPSSSGSPTASSSQDASVFQKKLDEIYGNDKPEGYSAVSYLEAIVNGTGNRNRFKSLVKKLGSDNYQERKRAEADLYSMPILPQGVQDYVATASELEVRFRLNAIFENRRSRVESLTIAALQTVGEEKSSEAFTNVLTLVKNNEEGLVKRHAEKALQLIAIRSHVPQLLENLKTDQVELKLFLADILVSIKPANLEQSLEPLLSDPHEKVRLRIATLLIDKANRKALQTLVDLVPSESAAIAIRANLILNAVTGEEFGQIKYSNQANNQTVADKWNQWADSKLKTAKLNLPLKDHLTVGNRLNGNTLIAMDSMTVIELNADRKEIFRSQQAGVLSAEKTHDGNYLLFSYSPGWLREVSPEGKTLWEIKGTKYNNAMPLENGNVLVSIGGSKLIQELDPKTKKPVWEYRTTWWPNDAFRLPNGNTLIGGKGGVIEVNPENKIVWQYDNPEGSTIVVAKPTPSGNVLVGWTQGIAREITRDKKTAWEYRTKSKLNDVIRDSNGHTFVAESTQIIEIDADKKVVWTMTKTSKTASIRR